MPRIIRVPHSCSQGWLHGVASAVPRWIPMSYPPDKIFPAPVHPRMHPVRIWRGRTDSSAFLVPLLSTPIHCRFPERFYVGSVLNFTEGCGIARATRTGRRLTAGR